MSSDAGIDPDRELFSPQPLQDSEERRIERIATEIRHGFAALANLGPAVTIFGSARTPADDPEYKLTVEIARALGEAGYGVITGGGPGIMEAANLGARDVGARSVGVEIQLDGLEPSNPYPDLTLRFKYFFARKVMLVRYADAFVVCPGGYGTFDELFEILTLLQTLKIRERPVVLVGTKFWSGLLEWLEREPLASGKISPDDMRFVLADSPDEVLAAIREARPRQARS